MEKKLPTGADEKNNVNSGKTIRNDQIRDWLAWNVSFPSRSKTFDLIRRLLSS